MSNKKEPSLFVKVTGSIIAGLIIITSILGLIALIVALFNFIF